MRVVFRLWCAAMLVCCSLGLLAQEQGAASAEEAAWMKFMLPGDAHAMLAKMVGKYDYDMTMWMAPDAPPEKLKGTSVYSMVMGGRFLQQEMTGNFMGSPFTGIGLTGYDNSRGIYLGTWMDNMGTSITYGEGSYDAATKTITITGKMTEPVKTTVVDYRYTHEVKDDGGMVFTMYLTMDGKEAKNFQMIYTKAN